MNTSQLTDTFTIKFTHEQMMEMREVFSDRFNHFATAYAPVGTYDKEKDLAYGIIKAIDVVQGQADYEQSYGDCVDNPFMPTLVEFLKDRRYCDDEHLEQQGVVWNPHLEVA